jgi:hypothetical protein
VKIVQDHYAYGPDDDELIEDGEVANALVLELLVLLSNEVGH